MAAEKQTDEENQDDRSQGLQPFKPKVRKSEALWMMSFSDLCLVLLCFFVLLLSISTMNTKKFDNVRHGMKKQTNTSDGDQNNLDQLSAKIKRIIKKKKIGKYAEVTLDADGLQIEFKNAILFASGSAKPGKKLDKIIKPIVKYLKKAPDDYNMVIEGHTDDIPIKSRQFPSNWHLSAERGFTLRNKLEGFGITKEKMAVVAFADTRPKIPVSGLKGSPLKKAQAANRRVVIRLH